MNNVYLNVNELVLEVIELAKAQGELQSVKKQLKDTQDALHMYELKEIEEKIRLGEDLDNMAKELGLDEGIEDLNDKLEKLAG